MLTISDGMTSYQKLVNRVAVPSLSRRSFRPREKYLILLVCLTFTIVCYGAFFYLPEYRGSSSSGSESRVYKMVQTMQKAGPNFLIPAPPYDGPTIIRHDGVEPHSAIDRAKFLARLQEHEKQEMQKNYGVLPRPSTSSSLGRPSKRPDIQPQLDVRRSIADTRPSIVTVPALPCDPCPVTQGGEDPDPSIQQKREKVKEMTKHAWDNYVRYAWGKNELQPMSKRGHGASIFGHQNLGATIIDGLDTLYIMNLTEEFEQGRNWIHEHLDVANITSELSVFETNIRFVGGLLTMYALTGDVVLRDKAEQIAEKLLPAFDTMTGIPHALVNFKTGASKNYGWASGGASILAEFGTLHLEFAYLSDVTGKPIYRSKVENIRRILRSMDKPKGLYPNFLHPKTGKWGQQHMSMGALGDSFYEYLLKAWIQSGKEDSEAREMYDEAMKHAIDNMLLKSVTGLLYFSDLKFDRVEHKMDHLACFSGGLLALGASMSERREPNSETEVEDIPAKHMRIAEGITNTCHESYARTATKLGPESFRFSEGVEARARTRNEKYYILRPEVIESYFVMWRLTKDKKYRDWGWEAVQALERHCRVENGFTGIKDVYVEQPVKDDVQQSFFLAETLKYLYLLFSDDSLISLDEWVFNTEAHPLPIKGRNPYYRKATTEGQRALLPIGT